jgi:hypothetical protein
MTTRDWFTLLAAAALSVVLPFRASALPDAQLARISVEGRNFHDGDSVPLTVEIRNGGDEPLPTASVILTLDEKRYAEWQPPDTLAPDQSVAWQLTWTAERGGHVFVATVDPLNDVIESDESNNSAFISVGAGGKRRIIPLSVTLVATLAFIVGAIAGFYFRGDRGPRARRSEGREPQSPDRD